MVQLQYMLLFLDVSKAFDKINHWVLFKKLLNKGVPIYLVKVLCYWYQHQSMYVKWGSTLSSKFQVTNGVRQGVPFLRYYSMYMSMSSVNS